MKIHKLFFRSKNPPLGKVVLLKRREGELQCDYGNGKTKWVTGYTYKAEKKSSHRPTWFVDHAAGNLVRSKKDFVAWCELPDWQKIKNHYHTAMFITPQIFVTIICTAFYVSFIWCCVTKVWDNWNKAVIPLVFVGFVVFVLGNVALAIYTTAHLINWISANWSWQIIKIHLISPQWNTTTLNN